MYLNKMKYSNRVNFVKKAPDFRKQPIATDKIKNT